MQVQAVSFISLSLMPRNVYLLRQKSGGAGGACALPCAGQAFASGVLELSDSHTFA